MNRFIPTTSFYPPFLPSHHQAIDRPSPSPSPIPSDQVLFAAQRKKIFKGRFSWLVAQHSHLSVPQVVLFSSGMALLRPPPGTVVGADVSAEDIAKKVRKPYTITKSRESWTEQEHDKFLEALQLFDRDWRKIEAFIGTKTVIQIRSHAQKYFLKVQKNGTGQHVPPPRPKRKSAQPYPQKATRVVHSSQQVATSMTLAEPAYQGATQPCTIPPFSSASVMPAWFHHIAPASSIGIASKGVPATTVGHVRAVQSKDQICIKSERSFAPPQQRMGMNQGIGDIVSRVLPDFGEVYSFLGSIFDPSANGHLERMREMAPIDMETVLLLMRNLSINLSSSDFEEHKLFLSVYDVESKEAFSGRADGAP